MKKAATFLFAAACLCFFTGCSKEEKASDKTSSGNAVADYVNTLGAQQQSAQKTLGAVGLDQSIKNFQIQENRLPKDLEELVSKGVISQLPPPPRGMKFDYDPKSGIVKVVPE